MPAETSEIADTGLPEQPRITGWLAALFYWPWRQAAEERERWILWAPVFIGAGVAAYFGLAFEPPIWLGAAGLAAALVLRIFSVRDDV